MSQSFSLKLTAVCAVLGTVPALADPIEDFYRGKTFNIYTGTGEQSTGAVVLYARTMSQVLGKHIPGKPTVVFRSMPGAGGIKAANYIYGIAPQDGTVAGFISRGFIIQPLIGKDQVQFDPTKFNWIGSTAREVSVGAFWSEGTSARSVYDAMEKEVVVGGTAASQDTGLYPAVMNNLIGTKFKIVTGYPSSTAVDLAMQRGEVQGKIGWTWGSLKCRSDGRLGERRQGTPCHPARAGKMPKVPDDVPLLLDLARTPEDRQVMELIFGPAATGYPSFMGPGVPPERVEAIRTAYRQTLQDPEFKDLLTKQKLELDPIEAGEIAGVVKKLFSLPPSIVERARALLLPS